MDFWKLMTIVHARQSILNPMRAEKMTHFIDMLDLPLNSRVIDIGCGKGEFLHRLYEKYNISGVGVDKSPYFIEDCKAGKVKRAADANIEYLLMDGKDYEHSEPFDLACCMGASWIYGGIKGTLEALTEMTRPRGLIVLGEPYWLREPDEEYLRLEDIKRDDFHSHRENVLIGEKCGITCVYTLVSDHMDWDEYETPHWWAVSEYADTHPNDPDLPEVLEYMRINREKYLKYGRDTMGWCLYVYRKSVHSTL